MHTDDDTVNIFFYMNSSKGSVLLAENTLQLAMAARSVYPFSNHYRVRC